MEWRLDELSARLSPSVHASRGRGDQRGALIMLVENHDEIASRVRILFAELVDPLDRLDKHSRVEPVRTVRGWCRGLPEPDVEDEAAESLDLVEQSIRELSEHTISSHVCDGEEAGSLLLPHRGVFTRPLDLESEHLALALKEPCPEAAHFCTWQHESREAEHRTGLVSWVCTADVGTDMPEFVKVGEVRHPRTSRNTKARAGARASEGGQCVLAPRYVEYIREPATSRPYGRPPL